MSQKGWQVTGLDLSAATVQRLRSELGLNALSGTLPHPALAPQSFEVVTMWHVLEHVHQPLQVLREAHRLLVPSGLLLIEVPNLASLGFQWFGEAWYGLELPRHLSHFTPQTLQAMLRRAGFQAGPIQMVPRTNWFRYSVQLACRISPPKLWHGWLKTKLGSRLTTWYAHRHEQTETMRVTAQRSG
jgi:SAM-dependent methyltransferase